MFVENYRLDTMIGGQAQSTIPYPKISDEDWPKWKAFLPVRSSQFCKELLLHKSKSFIQIAYGIPQDVCDELVRGANYFKEVEVWGKREIRKDPIAVGITESATATDQFNGFLGPAEKAELFLSGKMSKTIALNGQISHIIGLHGESPFP